MTTHGRFRSTSLRKPRLRADCGHRFLAGLHAVPVGVCVGVGAAVALAGPAFAQVGPNTPYFEIDGDDGDVLADQWQGDGTGYLPALDVTMDDSELHTWGRRQSPCDSWAHTTIAPYMGARSYRGHCEGAGTQRRTEQMILSDWFPDADERQRYFSLAFRLVDVPAAPAPGTRGFIGQLHQGSTAPLPFRFQWEYLCPPDSAQCGYYLTMGIRWGSGGTFQEFGIPIGGGRRGFELSPDTWYRMLFRISLVPDPEHAPCPGTGEVQAWLMEAETGRWSEVGYYAGPLGSEAPPCDFQWKVGLYANNADLITVDYDNVAFGMRWNNITKNRLVGYSKTVLDLWFDEGSGSVVNDHSYWWNGGTPGDPVADYDNDGTIQGSPAWNTDGVAHGGSLRLDGSDYVVVPMDEVDFDFGNYGTVSCWFRTTDRPADNRGLVAIDEFASSYKIKLHLSDANLSFGVRYTDGSHASLNHAFPAGTYADGEWHHVVGTFNRFSPDGQRLKLYLDGYKVLELPGSDLPLLRGVDRLAVGKYSGSGMFVGDIDEVLVRNYAMTEGEVLELFDFYMPGVVGVPEEPAELSPPPMSVAIHPNPGRAPISIWFDAPRSARARLTVLDATGRIVARPLDGDVTPGPHEAVWDGRDRSGVALPSGVYFFRLDCGVQTESGALILLR